MAQVLRQLTELFPDDEYPQVLVGLGAPDDAAVVRIDGDRALVVSVDFFTPVVDDAEAYGAIAAANSLSDLYAMGARPLFALNVAALPKEMPPEVRAALFRGGATVAREAGIPIVGGHSVDDEEPKYGLIVVGEVDPERMITRAGVRPGDRLALTKPLGTGVITTALKQGKARPEEVAAAVASMRTLNRAAAAAARAGGVRGGTDVTGYGLLGHGLEVARASGVTLVLEREALPWLPGARRLGAAYVFPGGAHSNRRYAAPGVSFDPPVEEEWEELLLYSPETSGGLLLAVPSAGVEAFEAACRAQGVTFWWVGEAEAGEGRVEVR